MTTDKAKAQAEQEKQKKLKALEATLGNIEKNFGKGTIMKLGENVVENIPAISTGSIGLDHSHGIG
jgi:recombination protein RecA